MKSTRILFLFALVIITFTSCKKQNPHDGCRPSKIPCPEEPRGVGGAILPQGLQAGSYVFYITIFYTNPVDNSGKLEFYIGGKEYASQTPLNYADLQNLGASSFGIALAVDTFTLTTVGYNTPQRCDCDPTTFQTHYNPPTLGLNADANKMSAAIFRNKWY